MSSWLERRRERLYGKKNKKLKNTAFSAAKLNWKRDRNQTYGEHEENQKQIKKLRKEGK